MFSTPILFLIFNRPETTIQVLERINAIKPTKLYVAADGPRPDREDEAALCNHTRQIVLDGINWDCEVKTLFREENLGCGAAPSSAITWFFENEEAGIILEDDCLPALSFFTFAEYCLSRYKDNPQIMHIGGDNFLNQSWGNQSYFYSGYNHVWGWATWRRAWKLYEFELQTLDSDKCQVALKNYFPDSISKGWFNFYKYLLERKTEKPDYVWDFWDYQWSFCIWLNGGLCIYPNVNLVSNIGFGPGATHTFDVTNDFNNLPHHELKSISSPNSIERNKKADIITSDVVFGFKLEKKKNLFFKKSYKKLFSVLGRLTNSLKSS